MFLALQVPSSLRGEWPERDRMAGGPPPRAGGAGSTDSAPDLQHVTFLGKPFDAAGLLSAIERARARSLLDEMNASGVD